MLRNSAKGSTGEDLDDGRTIADMSDVDAGVASGFRRVALRGGNAPRRDISEEIGNARDLFSLMMGTLGAALSIAGVYIVAFAVVIAIMLAVWT